MVVKFLDYDWNTFTFVCALPFDVDEKPKLEVGDGINGVVDVNTKINPTKCNQCICNYLQLIVICN
jgi:hypothetical protein